MQKIKEGPIIYCGYYFHENGTVTDSSGKIVAPSIDKYGNRSILLYIPDPTARNGIKMRRIYIARAMYNLYHGVNLPKNMIIEYLDGDKGNYGIHNLTVTKKPSPFQKRVLSEEQVEEIKALYNNKDKHFHSQWTKREGEFSLRELAEKYHVSVNTIQRVIADKYHCNKTIEDIGKEKEDA